MMTSCASIEPSLFNSCPKKDDIGVTHVDLIVSRNKRSEGHYILPSTIHLKESEKETNQCKISNKLFLSNTTPCITEQQLDVYHPDNTQTPSSHRVNNFLLPTHEQTLLRHNFLHHPSYDNNPSDLDCPNIYDKKMITALSSYNELNQSYPFPQFKKTTDQDIDPITKYNRGYSNQSQHDSPAQDDVLATLSSNNSLPLLQPNEFQRLYGLRSKTLPSSKDMTLLNYDTTQKLKPLSHIIDSISHCNQSPLYSNTSLNKSFHDLLTTEFKSTNTISYHQDHNPSHPHHCLSTNQLFHDPNYLHTTTSCTTPESFKELSHQQQYHQDLPIRYTETPHGVSVWNHTSYSPPKSSSPALHTIIGTTETTTPTTTTTHHHHLRHISCIDLPESKLLKEKCASSIHNPITYQTPQQIVQTTHSRIDTELLPTSDNPLSILSKQPSIDHNLCTTLQPTISEHTHIDFNQINHLPLLKNPTIPFEQTSNHMLQPNFLNQSLTNDPGYHRLTPDTLSASIHPEHQHTSLSLLSTTPLDCTEHLHHSLQQQDINVVNTYSHTDSISHPNDTLEDLLIDAIFHSTSKKRFSCNDLKYSYCDTATTNISQQLNDTTFSSPMSVRRHRAQTLPNSSSFLNSPFFQGYKHSLYDKEKTSSHHLDLTHLQDDIQSLTFPITKKQSMISSMIDNKRRVSDMTTTTSSIPIQTNSTRPSQVITDTTIKQSNHQSDSGLSTSCWYHHTVQSAEQQHIPIQPLFHESTVCTLDNSSTSQHQSSSWELHHLFDQINHTQQEQQYSQESTTTFDVPLVTHQCYETSFNPKKDKLTQCYHHNTQWNKSHSNNDHNCLSEHHTIIRQTNPHSLQKESDDPLFDSLSHHTQSNEICVPLCQDLHNSYRHYTPSVNSLYDSGLDITLDGIHSQEHLHTQGRCKPCAFFYNKKKGCRNGNHCEFCHHEDHSKLALKQWKKQQQKVMKLGRHILQHTSSPLTTKTLGLNHQSYQGTTLSHIKYPMTTIHGQHLFKNKLKKCHLIETHHPIDKQSVIVNNTGTSEFLLTSSPTKPNSTYVLGLHRSNNALSETNQLSLASAVCHKKSAAYNLESNRYPQSFLNQQNTDIQTGTVIVTKDTSKQQQQTSYIMDDTIHSHLQCQSKHNGLPTKLQNCQIAEMIPESLTSALSETNSLNLYSPDWTEILDHKQSYLNTSPYKKSSESDIRQFGNHHHNSRSVLNTLHSSNYLHGETAECIQQNTRY